MAGRRARQVLDVGAGTIDKPAGNSPLGPQGPQDVAGGVRDTFRNSRQNMQGAAVGVNVGSLRDYAINQQQAIQPMTIGPAVEGSVGNRGERRGKIQQDSVDQALKNFE